MEENVFRILGIQSREDCVTNALEHAINQSEEFRRGFLKHICEREPDAYKDYEAHTRVSTGEPGVPDLVLVCKAKDKAELIVVENKLKADEGTDQTERYGSEECINALRQRFCGTYPRGRIDTSFVFLTLFPDQEPSSKKFLIKRHSDLLAIEHRRPAHSVAEQLVFDWMNLLERFYSKSKIDLKDRIGEKLKDDEGLDGGYLYFRTFLSELRLPRGMEIQFFYRGSAPGRHYYGAVFSKDNWHPGEMTPSGSRWMLEPNEVFNIHFEPQFNALNGIFSIFLHYEVNPYAREAWVKKNVPANQYEAYLQRRRKFVDLLKNKRLKDWNFARGGSNQIARAKLDINERLVKDAKYEIEELFAETSAAIDEVLSEI